MSDRAVYKHLKEFGHVKPNAPLSKLTSFKIGGPADFLIEVTDTKKLGELLSFLSEEGIDHFVLGGGSNVLFPDEGMRGAVIKIKNDELKITNTKIFTGAGGALSKVVEVSVAAGLTGFEWAAGIPGSVGGAVRGNAGAHYAFTGGEMKDSITKVIVWQDGQVVEFFNSDCAFGYRDSIFKHSPYVVLGVEIALKAGNKAESVVMTQKIIAERKGKQSSEPSAGSFFKNVMLSAWKHDTAELPKRFLEYKKIASGWLVDQCGLKGYTVGNAMVSIEHANFIVNKGGATQADVLAVVDEVVSRVYDKFEITLEPEVQIVR